MVQVSGLVNVLLTVALTVMAAGVIAIIIIVAQLPGTPLVCTTTDSVECDYGNVCTIGCLVADSYCEPKPAKASTSCDTACSIAGATSGHCNPVTQQCVLADPQECRGWCSLASPILMEYGSPECTNALFPVYDILLHPENYDAVNFWDKVFPDDALCVANSCVRSAMTIQLTTDSVNWLNASYSNAAPLSCLDVLNSSALNKTCLEVTEIAINTPKFSENLILHEGAYAASNYTGRYCFFRYACAQFNSTYIDTLPSNAKRSLHASTSTYLLPLNEQTAFKKTVAESTFRQFLLDRMEKHVSETLEKIKVERKKAVS